MLTPSRLAVGFARRHGWQTLGAMLVALMFVTAVILHKRPAELYLHPPLASSSSMFAIEQLVATGKLSDAAIRLKTSFRFDQPIGLAALQRFSMFVLRRGLSERDPFERCFAASALVKGGSRQEIGVLVRIFQGNPDLSLKMAVADGLGDAGDADSVASLQTLYYSARSFDRRIVVNGMAQATDPGAITVLSDAARGPDDKLRLAGLRGLGHLGNRDAIPLLRRVVATPGSLTAQAMAAGSLLRLGDASGLDALMTILKRQSDPGARAVAAMGLGYAREPRVVPLLKQAIYDGDIDVRIAAAAALTHYTESRGADYLRSAMFDNDPVTRQHVGQVLDEVAFGGGYRVLIAAVKSPDQDLEMSGLRALGLGGGEKELELMSAMLPRASDPIVRAQVAWAMGRIGSPRAIEPLVAMIQEPAAAVRYTAADALDRTAERLLAQERS
jgi:HEAT repeat protein